MKMVAFMFLIRIPLKERIAVIGVANNTDVAT